MTVTNDERAADTSAAPAVADGGHRRGRLVDMGRCGADLALLAVLAAACHGLLQLITLPTSALFARVAIDDALYFVMPAHQFWQGHGFAFDGLHRSSGVQPLWAAIVLLLAGVFRDSETCVRVACAASGLFWLASSAVLYRALRGIAVGAGLLLAVGWAIFGMRDGLGAKGMENGVNAFVLALLVAAALRIGRGGHAVTLGAYLRVGLLAALFSLARTENLLLAALASAAMLLGRLPVQHGKGAAWRWQGALALGLPALFAVGACTAAFVTYFDTWLPISGTVKLHYERQWGGVAVHGGVFGSLCWHVDAVMRQAFAVLAQLLQRALPATPLEAIARGVGVAVAVVTVLLVWRWWRTARSSATAGLALVGIGWAVVHLALMALTLPHFTGYGTWYFTAEYLAAWGLAVASAFALLRALRLPAAAASAGCAALALGLLAAEAKPLVRPPAAELGAVQVLHEAGRWMNEQLPAGRRIGTLSSGYVSQAAPAHTVYNLDGLMADREYVDGFLRPGRLPEYLQREQIEFFADYQSLADWKAGLQWAGSVPLEQMRLVRWWRMDATLAYCVFALSGRGAAAPFDQVSQLQFAAEVTGRYRVVGDEELATLPAQHRVVTSIPQLTPRTLRHVVVPVGDVAALGLTARGVHPERRSTATFAGAVRLLGVDLTPHPVPPGGRILLSRYWQVERPWTGGAVTLELRLDPADGVALAAIPESERLLVAGRPCHGTSDLAEWRVGEVVVETYALVVPASLPPGVYPISIGWRDTQGGWLPVSEGPAESRAEPALVFVGNVDVRR